MPSLAIGKRLHSKDYSHWKWIKTCMQNVSLVFDRLLSCEATLFIVQMTPCRAIRRNNLVFCPSTGLMNVDQYISLLARLIEDNEPALVATRADRWVLIASLTWMVELTPSIGNSRWKCICLAFFWRCCLILFWCRYYVFLALVNKVS